MASEGQVALRNCLPELIYKGKRSLTPKESWKRGSNKQGALGRERAIPPPLEKKRKNKA